MAGKLNRAGSWKACCCNESGWHKFFHALTTIARWVGVALVVVAVIALVVALPGIAEMGLMAALASATTVGGAVVTIGGASVSLASVAIYGGVLAAGTALAGDIGQHATGSGPSWGRMALDAAGLVPGLGKAATVLGRLGGPVGDLANVLHDGAIGAKLATAYKVENLFGKVEYTEFGINHAKAMDRIEGILGKVNKGLLGYGENRPVTGAFGATTYAALRLNTLWGGAGMLYPEISKQHAMQVVEAGGRSYLHDLSAADARAQIQQYQQTDPAGAARARELAANLAKGDRGSYSYPRQHQAPQTVPVR